MLVFSCSHSNRKAQLLLNFVLHPQIRNAMQSLNMAQRAEPRGIDLGIVRILLVILVMLVYAGYTGYTGYAGYTTMIKDLMATSSHNHCHMSIQVASRQKPPAQNVMDPW